MRAVVDRIVDNKLAVILVGEEEHEYQLPLTELPVDARESSIIDVTIENGEIISVSLSNDDIASDVLRKKFNNLKNRQRSNFKRS